VRRLFWIVGLLAIAVGLTGLALGRGWLGVRQDGGEITQQPIPSSWVGEGALIQREAAREIGESGRSQILFGDLHVHTTFSLDAFMMSLPMLQGEGAHPPADACDFARFCSGLDFWSINDHAEGLTSYQWAETKRIVRECQAVSGGPASPDLVSYLGWEWTQIGITPEDHYGHKNVVLLDLEEDAVPTRPIASRRELFPPGAGTTRIGALFRLLMIAGAPSDRGRQPYLDAARFLQDRDDVDPCPTGVPVRELPATCQEGAPTPRDLFARLDEWGAPYMVIPHGNTWGIYTPPGTTWDKQLAAHDEPERREPLIEVFSGHGNSEEYRDWRAVEIDAGGAVRCPEPRADYLPSCWHAGEIIRARCTAQGESADECERRAIEARQNHAEAGNAGHVTVPGARNEDWLDAGQCPDCYMPAFNYRPGGSTQYALALSNFDDPGRRRRFRFGFIASSDSHTARPGTGYKESNRREMTESALAGVGGYIPRDGTPEARSISLDSGVQPLPEFERSASFFGTGGLVAVHSAGRDREAIWRALERREVYGTSGERILLWFDLLSGGDAPTPMGSSVSSSEDPRFRVRAVGAFRQDPGCPEHSVSALPPERLEHLCRGECYNPSDERKLIRRIEVIRIRPQTVRDEPVADLIDDPWRVYACPADAAGCSIEFDDPDFVAGGRDALYYVRAIQEPGPTINGAGLRCTRDDTGRCVSVSACYGDPKTDYEDDCLAETEERAWSSPIYLEFAAEDAL
jgi:hypothetical protein